MKIFMWNCRGAGSDLFVRVAKDLISDQKPDVMAFIETRIGDKRAEGIIRRLGSFNFVKVDAQGFREDYGSFGVGRLI